MGAPVKYPVRGRLRGRKWRRDAKPTVPLADARGEIAARGSAEAQAEGRRQGRHSAGQDRRAHRRRLRAHRAGDARLAASATARSRRDWRPKPSRLRSRWPRKLAPELIAAEPLRGDRGAASGCFRQLIATPHVVVRIAEPIYEHAHKRLEDIARMQGFDGRLVVLAEPGIGARRLQDRMGRRRPRTRPRRDRSGDRRGGRALHRGAPRSRHNEILGGMNNE